MFPVKCPRSFCSDMVLDINMASLADKGALPAAGGLLDQTQWFLDLWAMLGNETERIKAELTSGNE